MENYLLISAVLLYIIIGFYFIKHLKKCYRRREDDSADKRDDSWYND